MADQSRETGRGGGRGRGFSSGGKHCSKASHHGEARKRFSGGAANIALNRRISHAAHEGYDVLLQVLVETKPEDLNEVNCCTAMNRLAKRAASSSDRAALQKHPAFNTLLCRFGTLLPFCDAMAVSITAHACASLGVSDVAFLSSLGDAIRARCQDFDRQGVANVLWALAKLPRTARGDAPLDALIRAAREFMDKFTPQELANIVWALPQLSVKNQQLIERLMLRARHQVDSFTPQGLSMLAQGFSSLGIYSDALFSAIGKAAMRQASKCNVQDAGQILAAFAKFKIHDKTLQRKLCAQALTADWEQEGNESVTTFLWALGSLGDSESEHLPLLHLLLERLTALAPTLRQRHVIYALNGLAKLKASARSIGLGSERFNAPAGAIVTRLLVLLDDLDPQELGLVAWALTILIADSADREKEVQKLFRNIYQCATKPEICKDLNWWSAAHLEYAIRQHPSLRGVAFRGGDGLKLTKRSDKSIGIAMSLIDSLTPRVAIEDARLCEESDKAFYNPEKALVDLAPWKTTSVASGRRALLVGVGASSELRPAIRAASYRTATWLRFAGSGKKTRPWPANPGKELYSVCCMRHPVSADALGYCLHAVAAVLGEGASLWVYGNVQEGVLTTASALAPLFDHIGTEGNNDSRIIAARRTRIAVPEAKLGIEAWLEEKSVDLGDGPRTWWVLPGLFAGGTLDVMTALLLDRMAESLQPKVRILDYGCGSGTLAAGLQARLEADVVLLDADAVALSAAQKNHPSSKIVLGDSLDALRGLQAEGEKFDIIASNPPVHRGRPDDWRVLRALLDGAPGVLRRQGELWLVAQEHVPVGRLIDLADGGGQDDPGHWESVLDFADGRFAVWRATWKRKRLRPPQSAEGIEGQPAARKKRKKQCRTE